MADLTLEWLAELRRQWSQQPQHGVYDKDDVGALLNAAARGLQHDKAAEDYGRVCNDYVTTASALSCLQQQHDALLYQYRACHEEKDRLVAALLEAKDRLRLGGDDMGADRIDALLRDLDAPTEPRDG